MKKLPSFVFITMLVLGTLCVPILGQQKGRSTPIDTRSSHFECSYEDELDQYMTDFNSQILPVGRIPEINISVQVAQSFIPTKEILTRVELYIGKNASTAYPYTVAIREELTADNLVEIDVEPAEVPSDNFSWVEFDFNNLWVMPGSTYYIVGYTENITDNLYLWGLNNDSESYPRGCAWMSIDDGNSWTNDSLSQESHDEAVPSDGKPRLLTEDGNTSDMCFKTYGISATTLQITVKKSLFGPSFIIKNIGNSTTFDVNWMITVQGGILARINETVTGQIPELTSGGEETIQLGVLVFGFGPITFTAKAHAINAAEVSITTSGFLLLIFYILFSLLT